MVTNNNNNTATILVVDDNDGNRQLLASQLQSRGYQILQADNGLTGMEIAQQLRPDIILLDVMMPGIDGFTVCSQLKADPQTSAIPIVMVTALRDVQHRIKGIEAGADEFLSRPYHREELLVRVKALVQLKRTRARLEEERNRLQLLYDVSRATTTQFDLTAMMMQIITHTQAAVGAAKGIILLLNETGDVTHKITIRAGQKPVIATHIAPDVLRWGLLGWIIRQNQRVTIDDVSQDERWFPLPDEEVTTDSVIGVPLSRVNRVVGALLLIHPQIGYFREEHLSLLSTIGAQVTAAIENAYLFVEVSEQRRKLAAILAQSTDAIITADQEGIITSFNQSSERFFNLRAADLVGRRLVDQPQLAVLKPLFSQAKEQPITQEVYPDDKRVLNASISPVRDVGHVVVMQDISRLKRLEQIRLEQERREKEVVKQTFSRYMGPRLVEHLLTTEPGLLARRERRRAVVLFADLRGFTRMIMRVEPDMAILTLNEFFTNMTDVVHEFEGTIFDLAGDELMVGFNVPMDQPDAPYRAFLVAVTMQHRFERLRRDWLEQIGTDLGLGVGIDEGDVVVGNVGAEARMNFAMVGEAVNTAHRLVEIAEHGEIIVSEQVYKAIASRLPELAGTELFIPRPPVVLKGKTEPQMLYKVRLEAVDAILSIY
jgi:PAS domain S-box-containing protein